MGGVGSRERDAESDGALLPVRNRHSNRAAENSREDYPYTPGGGRSMRDVNQDDEDIDYSRRFDPDPFARSYGASGSEALPTVPILFGLAVSFYAFYILGQAAAGGGLGPATWSCAEPHHPDTNSSSGSWALEEEEDFGVDLHAEGPPHHERIRKDAQAGTKDAEAVLHATSWAMISFILPVSMLTLTRTQSSPQHTSVRTQSSPNTTCRGYL